MHRFALFLSLLAATTQTAEAIEPDQAAHRPTHPEHPTPALKRVSHGLC